MLDLFAHAPQFFFHLEQIGNFAGVLIQHLQKAFFHPLGVAQPGVGVEVGFRDILGPERLVLQFAEAARFLQEAIEILRHIFTTTVPCSFPLGNFEELWVATKPFSFVRQCR